ncbi:MAG: hypothetical protein ACRD2G_02505 [Terriglobia bacterium]
MHARRTLKSTLYLLTLALCVSIPLQAQDGLSQHYTFKPVRIVAGGFITGFVAQPLVPGLFYVRTDIGSTYRWDSSKQIWAPLTDFESPANYLLTGTESIAIDPTDPNRLYLAQGMYTQSFESNYAILASADRGRSFKTYPVSFRMGSNNNGRNMGERLGVNPFKPNELYMGTREQGLWVSEDYAQTWTESSTFPIQSSPQIGGSSSGYMGLPFVVFDPHHPGTVYVANYAQNGLYVTTNDGQTWSQVPGQLQTFPTGNQAPALPMRGALGPGGNLYVTYGDNPGPNNLANGAVMKYNPKTQTWTNITPPLDPQEGSVIRGGFCGLSVDPNQPGLVAVATLDRWYPVDSVYVSRDGGASWANLGLLTSPTNDGNYGNYAIPLTDAIVPGGPKTPGKNPVPIPWLSFGGTSYPPGTAKFGWWQAAVLIDPWNPDHLMYGTGATIYSTDDLSSAYSGVSPTWHVGGWGIEETAVTALISPSSGAHLLSGVGDIGGFRHDDLKVSPLGGMYANPIFTTTNGLDWAGQKPSVIVRSGTPSSPSVSPCSYGGYSTDGGTTWTEFPACNTDLSQYTYYGGGIAVDASGADIAWHLFKAIQVSTDRGATWTPGIGAPSATPVSDKVQAATFYACSGTSFYASVDDASKPTLGNGGASWVQMNATPLPGCAMPVANFAAAGDLWLALGNNGLWHSTDYGATWAQVGGPTSREQVTAANQVALGKARPGRRHPAIFLYGTVSTLGIQALYRSDNGGRTWVRINNDRHQYGGVNSSSTAYLLQGDPRVYGRVYFGMNGRGIIYGDIHEEPGEPRGRDR